MNSFKRTCLTAVLASAILFLSCCPAAFALPGSSRAMAAVSKHDPTFFYVGFSDARKLAEAFGRSEIVRFIANYDPVGNLIKDFLLKDFPVRDFSLMTSSDGEYGSAFQLAVSFDDSKRGILDKIAAGKASDADIALLFGGNEAFVDFFDIYIPESDDEYYESGMLDLFFTSFENLLVMGDSEETLKKSLAACKSRFRRQNFNLKGSGNNTVFMSLGRDAASEMIDLISYISGQAIYPDETGEPSRINLESNIELVPGGWDLELFTNVVSAIYGSRFDEISYRKTPETFFSAGGGRLIAAIDSTPDMGQISASSRGFMLELNRGLQELMLILEDLLGKGESDELGEAFLSIDRMNLALTGGEIDRSDLRPYLLLSSRKAGVTKRMGEIFSGLADRYAHLPEVEIMLERFDIPGWDSCYSVLLPPEASWFTKQGRLTVAFGERGLFAGLMPPLLMGEKFKTGSNLYSTISEARVMEIAYFDMRLLRKIAKSLVEATDADRSVRHMIATIAIPLMDIREIGIQTHSSGHFSLKFRTGWLDFEERDFIIDLLR